MGDPHPPAGNPCRARGTHTPGHHAGPAPASPALRLGTRIPPVGCVARSLLQRGESQGSWVGGGEGEVGAPDTCRISPCALGGRDPSEGGAAPRCVCSGWGHGFPRPATERLSHFQTDTPCVPHPVWGEGREQSQACATWGRRSDAPD